MLSPTLLYGSNQGNKWMKRASPLTTSEKIGYGLGDMASALVWQTSAIFLGFFYTDVYGLSAEIMGTMFLLVRIFDACADPVIGALVDRTSTSHGQFRPWLLWFAFPFGLSCMMTFYVPDLGPTGKVIYAVVTYTFLSFVYSAVNVPYCAMPGALTRDPQERHSLQSFRFALSFTGGLIVTLIALPLVNYLGGGDIQRGYFYAMGLMGVLGIFLFYLCFFMTREKYTTENRHSSLREEIKLLTKNGQWRLMMLLTILLLVAGVIRSTSTIYYVKYVLRAPGNIMLFISSGMLAGLMGALSSHSLLGRFDKVQVFRVVLFAYSVICAGIFFIPAQDFWIIFIANLLFNFLMNLCTPLQWTMLSDIVEYEEYRSHHRLDGLVFSTSLFAIKTGLALGGAVVGWILGWAHYLPDGITQSRSVTVIISGLFTFIPAAVFMMMGVLLFLYHLNNHYMNEITKIKVS